MKRFAALLLLWLGLAGSFATDRTVYLSEPNTPPNFWTIGGAIAASTAGDRIFVGPGVFTEDLTVDKDLLQIIGTNFPANPFIVQGRIVLTADWITMRQFCMSNWTTAGDGFVTSGKGGHTISQYKICNGKNVALSHGQFFRNTWSNYLHTFSITNCFFGLELLSVNSPNGNYSGGAIVENFSISDIDVDGLQYHGRWMLFTNFAIERCMSTNYLVDHPDCAQGIAGGSDGLTNQDNVIFANGRMGDSTQGGFSSGGGSAAGRPNTNINYINVQFYQSSNTVNGVNMTNLGMNQISLLGSDALIQGCLFTGCRQYNILGSNQSGLAQTNGVKVINCVFDGNPSPNISINVVSNMLETVQSCIQTNNYRVASWSAPVAFYTSFADAAAAHPTIFLNDYDDSPGLNPYPTPTATSAASFAVDHGYTGSSHAYDFLGVARPQRLAWDIGPYELPGTVGFILINGTPYGAVGP